MLQLLDRVVSDFNPHPHTEDDTMFSIITPTYEYISIHILTRRMTV